MALPMCARQHVRDGKQMGPYALCSWSIRVKRLADDHRIFWQWVEKNQGRSALEQ